MKKIWIAVGAFLGILVIANVIMFFTSNREDSEKFTGGSGQPESGHLILTGYETPSNDSSKIPLGKFLNTDQQKEIRTHLESLLEEREFLREYRGSVMPGSFEVNYMTNILTFKIKIEKPKLLYVINYDTMKEELKVYDEKGELLTPSNHDH